MNTSDQPLPEITLKVIIVSIILTIILAASNTYLALKIGILTSASIPAAVLSMGILRFFKRATIFENNLIQTAASAGEAVAGGIVYTIPALIIIHYWSGFSYWENLAIALVGGILGVLFSIPMRRTLMTAKYLNFPEGVAIAEILRTGAAQSLGLRQMLLGGSAGAFLELLQNGVKLVASTFQSWFATGSTLFGFGGGFSATLIGAGYIIGFRVGISIFIGAVIAWGILIPILSTSAGTPIVNPITAINNIYAAKIHYIGIGGMLVAGLWTLIMLLKPFYESLRLSVVSLFKQPNNKLITMTATERDIPINYVILGILVVLILLYFLLRYLFPLMNLGIPDYLQPIITVGSLFYILIIGFIFAAICGYFSGLVGVSASPGSAVIIAGMLLAALILRGILHIYSNVIVSAHMLNAAAITIIIGAVVTGAAAIANDNIQDLKVGHIIGATPWKQQLMLLLGVLVAAAVIPPIMQLLFHVYGIGNVFPRPGMDPSAVLAAPPAAMMAAITQGVFAHDLPWDMLALGAGIVVALIIINQFLRIYLLELSILSVAIGMYLPLSSSIPLFIGSCIALISKRALNKHFTTANATQKNVNAQKNLLLACGLVSGAALMDVVLAIPMAIRGNPDALSLLPKGWENLATTLGIASVLLLGYWFYRVAISKKFN